MAVTDSPFPKLPNRELTWVERVPPWAWVVAFVLLVMPLIAMILGLNLGRIPRSSGILLGILFLLGVQKVFEYLLAISGNASVAAWAAFWPFVGLIAITALVLFQRLANRRILPGPHIRIAPKAAYVTGAGRKSPT